MALLPLLRAEPKAYSVRFLSIVDWRPFNYETTIPWEEWELLEA
jgi:hypothetical protein